MRRGVNDEGATGSCALATRLVELKLCADTAAAVAQINAGLVQVDGNIVAGNVAEEGGLVEVQRHQIIAIADSERAQQQARNESKQRNVTLRKARKAAKSAEEKLARGQKAEALRQFKSAHEIFAEAGINHGKVRESIIALEPGWNPLAAASFAALAPKIAAAVPAAQPSAEGSWSRAAQRSAAVSPPPVAKLDISSELADDSLLSKLGGERGWADYTPDGSSAAAHDASAAQGGSPVAAMAPSTPACASKRVQAVLAQGARSPAATGPAAGGTDPGSTRPGTFLYSATKAGKSPFAGEGDAHLIGVRPVGDEQASALRPPLPRKIGGAPGSGRNSSRSPPQTRRQTPESAPQRSSQAADQQREGMPTVPATPVPWRGTTPRAAGPSRSMEVGSVPFTPSSTGRSQARYDYLTGNQQQHNYSGSGGGNGYPPSGGYRYRSPSPSRNGGASQRGSGSFRRTSPFDKHPKVQRSDEISVKFDWTAAPELGSSSDELFHRVRVRLSGSDGKPGEMSGGALPSWSSVVGQQVSCHGVGDHVVSFSFIDDEQDECKITSEEEWLVALGLHAAKTAADGGGSNGAVGPLRVRVESRARAEQQEAQGGGGAGGSKVRQVDTIGAALLALCVGCGCAYASWL